MPITPGQLGTGSPVSWTIPKEISVRVDIDSIKVWRSSSIDSGYSVVETISFGAAGALETSFLDTTAGNSRDSFYLVTFVSTASAFESPYHITFFPPLPSEAILVEKIRRSVPEVIRATLTDEDYLNGLGLAVQIFNVYPPETGFTLATFPKSHEFFIIGIGSLLALSSRYLVLSIRDFRYSEPGGVVMDIDRGAKINEALTIITKVYTQYLPLVKLDFAADSALGLGTVQLPLSAGGMISRSALSILDIFTAVGRIIIIGIGLSGSGMV